LIWVSGDIAKGGRERWLPVIPDLADVTADIRASVGPDEYVLPAQRFRNPPINTVRQDLALRACSSQALRSLVIRVTQRAGLAEHIRPHDLRHAYAEHIARETDTRIAQHLLGHANLGTTDIYLGSPRIDDMVAAVKGATFAVRTNVLGAAQMVQIPHKATTGIEPV
jgi:integrase